MDISCLLPTTVKRLAFIPPAIRYFLRQTYLGTRELVVVTDGDGCDEIVKLLPAWWVHEGVIRHEHLPKTIPLSDKYQRCCELARYSWMAFWADDDWMAPTRLAWLSEATRRRPGVEIVGQRGAIFHRMGTDRTWMWETTRPPAQPHFLGGTCMWARSYWERHPFATGKPRCADSSFTNDIDPEEYKRVALPLLDRDQYVVINHANNTGRNGLKDPSLGSSYTPYTSDIRLIFGADSPLYCSAAPETAATGRAP